MVTLGPMVGRRLRPFTWVIAVVGVMGCELEEVTIPPGDEIIVVHSVMRPDEGRQFVVVERSWRGVEDPAELDRFDVPPSAPQIPVTGATVTVRNLTFPGDPCGATVNFAEVGDGLYRSPANCPTMRAGDSVALEISGAGVEPVRGVTQIAGLDSATVITASGAARFGTDDSLTLNRDTDTLHVSVAGGPGRLVELQSNRIDYFGVLSVSEFDRSTVLADTTEVSVPADVLDLLERGEGDEVFRAGRHYVMTVGLADRNYWDFVRSQNSDVTGRGFINHLDGAIGVFGSMEALAISVKVEGSFDDPREGVYRMVGVVEGVPVNMVLSVYLHHSADSSDVSAFLDGGWVWEIECPGNPCGWQPWFAPALSVDGTTVGDQFEIVVIQPILGVLGEQPARPIILTGVWASGSFTVSVESQGVFGTRPIGTLTATKQ